MPKEPTEKQRRAALELLEDAGNKGKALVRAGYSEKTALTPDRVIESEGFKAAILESGIKENELAELLKGGLYATRSTKFGPEDDWTVRHKWFESAVRLLGYVKEDQGTTNNYNTFVQNNIVNPNEEENKKKLEQINKIMMGEV